MRILRLLPFVFLAAWAFHLHSAGGTLIAYRDTGEMAADAHSLGVAHSPGYPLYVLAGRIADSLPLGNTAYRLNALSALASALTACVLFALIAEAAGAGAAACVTIAWVSSTVFWELSSVSEMYTLSLLAMALLLFAAKRLADEPGPRLWFAAAFVAGLACGFRTDIVLFAPAFLWLFYRRGDRAWFLPCALFFLAGFTVFFYLPLRSGRQPWIDWNNPEHWDHFMGSLLRRTHGGTLDLLSKSYRTGENFLSEFVLYLRDSGRSFGWLGFLAIAAGAGALRRRSREFAVFTGLAFLTTAPLFIFLANLPPNPHALAIVEAHYLPSQLLLAVAAGCGLGAFFDRFGSRAARVAAVAAIALLAAANGWTHRGRGDKRWNFYLRDFVTNATRFARPGSVGVLREDVPLFSLWETQLVSSKRPDVDVVAQGLAASPWYHEMVANQGRSVPLGPLRTEEDWNAFRARLGSRPLWVSGDADLAWRGETAPAGLLSYVPAGTAPAPAPWPFHVMRGGRDQSAAPDFFSSDLLSAYAKARLGHAGKALRGKDWDAARRDLLAASRLDPESPSIPFNLGFVAFEQGRIDEAERYYARATRLYDDMFRRAREYRTLPDTVAGLRREAAEIWVHRGVVAERRGVADEARNCYAEAVRLNPASAQAHYNWAVTFWNRDWPQAVAHLEAASALEPGNPQFRGFLKKAKAVLAKGSSR